MPRTCAVCRHPARGPIDTEIVTRVPFRDIAKQHGLSSSSVWRHSQHHLPDTLVRAADVAEVTRANTLLDKVSSYIADAEAIMANATTDNDRRLALLALDRAMSGVTLLAKLTGDIDEHTNINVLVTTPEWAQLSSTILAALAPYPEAAAAVRAALRPSPRPA